MIGKGLFFPVIMLQRLLCFHFICHVILILYHVMKFQRPCVFSEAWLGTAGIVYIEIFVGILFHKIVKKLAL